MPSANQTQIGGDHYKNPDNYEHWDLVLDCGLDYLVGVATKYVARHRKKNGREDLLKALHYTQKLKEAERVGLVKPAVRVGFDRMDHYLLRFTQANDIGPLEHNVLLLFLHWCYPADIELIEIALKRLLEHEPRDPAPVPLTEENHYAERAPRAELGGVNEDQA